MQKNRMEAFSDGVFAIVATLLVIELKVPPPDQPLGPALTHMLPKIVAYALSFVIVGMYWVAHHSMLAQARQVDRGVLWLNNFTLMVVAFIPFPTALLGERPSEPMAAAMYGATLIAVNSLSTGMWVRIGAVPGLGCESLSRSLVRRVALTHIAPVVPYTIAIGVAQVSPMASLPIFALVPLFFVAPNPWLRQFLS